MRQRRRRSGSFLWILAVDGCKSPNVSWRQHFYRVLVPLLTRSAVWLAISVAVGLVLAFVRSGRMGTFEELVMVIAGCAMLLTPIWLVAFGLLVVHQKGHVGSKLWFEAFGLAALIAAT